MSSLQSSSNSAVEQPVELTQRRPSGNGHTRKVKFQVRAAPRSKVCVAGTFNNWSEEAHPLRNAGKGLYRAMILLPPGLYEYKFVVDGQWQIDEDCGRWTTNPYGSLNSVIEVV